MNDDLLGGAVRVCISYGKTNSRCNRSEKKWTFEQAYNNKNTIIRIAVMLMLIISK